MFYDFHQLGVSLFTYQIVKEPSYESKTVV